MCACVRGYLCRYQPTQMLKTARLKNFVQMCCVLFCTSVIYKDVGKQNINTLLSVTLQQMHILPEMKHKADLFEVGRADNISTK